MRGAVLCWREKLDEKPKLCGDVEKLKKEMEEYEKAHENIPFLSPPLVTNGTFALELSMKEDLSNRIDEMD